MAHDLDGFIASCTAAISDGDRFVGLHTLRHRLDRVTGEPQRKTA